MFWFMTFLLTRFLRTPLRIIVFRGFLFLSQKNKTNSKKTIGKHLKDYVMMIAMRMTSVRCAMTMRGKRRQCCETFHLCCVKNCLISLRKGVNKCIWIEFHADIYNRCLDVNIFFFKNNKTQKTETFFSLYLVRI